MRFELSDEQREIREAVRDLLARRQTFERLRNPAGPTVNDAALWADLGSGWLGVGIPEDLGGAGAGLVELAVISEELGYAVAGTPYLPTIAAAVIIDHAGSEEARRAFLPRIASHELTAAVQVIRDGVPELTPCESPDVAVIIEDGVGRLVVGANLQVTPVETIDPTRRYATLSGDGEVMPGDVAGGLARVAVLVAAESVGVTQRALDVTVAFVKQRQQFGTPIGAFQAVQHSCVRMLQLLEGARSAMYYAAWQADNHIEGWEAACAVAKVSAADGAVGATAAGIQNHGGIGFTWEADPHWLYKRACMNSRLFGSGEHFRRVLADHVLALKAVSV